jgi:hypothetical protein
VLTAQGSEVSPGHILEYLFLQRRLSHQFLQSFRLIEQGSISPYASEFPERLIWSVLDSFG